jgi:deoxyadenosine/deoxycytidine kinase
VIQNNIPTNSNNFRLDYDKHLYVSYGTPCSGKSTAFYSWAEKFNINLVTDNTILDDQSPLFYYLVNAFEKGNKSFFFHFQMEVLPLRFWQMASAPNRSLIDESIFSTLAYSRALYNLKWITDYEYNTFNNNYISYRALLPAQITIYYFHCNNDTVLERLKIRNRPIECSSYSLEYISALRDAFDFTFAELKGLYKVVEIDTEILSLDEVLHKCSEAQILIQQPHL